MARSWLFLGPAFVAAVAYVDPGNFATNIEAGSELGYQLIWVVVAANVAAIVIQTQSAKLGLVSGHSLPEHIRDRARRRWRSPRGLARKSSRWRQISPSSLAPASGSAS